MRAWLVPAAAVLVAACGPTSPAGASGELQSLFRFAAYPNGTLVTEQAYPNSSGPFYSAANTGYREYRTTDGFAAVQAYYTKLGQDNGWVLTPQAMPSPGTAWDTSNVLQMSYGRFMLTISLESSPRGPNPFYCGGSYCVQPPAGPPPMEKPTAPPTDQGSPSPTPTTSPSPTPTPSAGPYYLRLDAAVRPTS